MVGPLTLDAGPVTLLPLLHVPLLKGAPRGAGEYRTITDTLGDLCHFYGDFSGYHLYMIASTYKKRLVPGSIDYYDPDKGQFAVSLSVTRDDGSEHVVRIAHCTAPVCEAGPDGVRYPDLITIEQFSPGTPDGIRFHFREAAPKFKFSCNLIPHLPPEQRLAEDNDMFSLNVEYIGKALGDDGTREVADRLGDGHSTESLILNEFVHKKTNREAFAVLYKPGRLTDAAGKPLATLPFGDVVDALEKSLIASFLPAKNVQSRKFPRDGSETARRLIEAGVDRLWVKLESPLEYGLLYTADADPATVHRFDLPLPTR